MTANEKEAHKEKVKKVMVDHLTELGYPNLSREQILKELKPMWIKLEEAGLIIEGMSYTGYCAMADDANLFAQIHEIMGI